MRIVLSALLLVASLLLQSQAQQQPRGLIPTPDAEYGGLKKYEPKRSTEIVRKIVNGQEVYELKIVEGPLPNLPPVVDLTEFAPPVGLQTFEDCTAWAAAYCCLSTQNAYARGRKEPADAVHQFSPRYTYAQINSGVDQGSYIYRVGNNNSAVGLFQDKGCSSNLLTSYITKAQNPNGYKVQPAAADFVEAANYPLYHHAICTTLDDIRYALVFRIPVVIAVHHENRFYDHTGSGNFVWQGGKNGAHAMCIIGYDNNKQAFRVQNSWGTNWGDQGRFWVGYDHFDKLAGPQRGNGWCFEAHALVLSPSQGSQLRQTPNLNLNTFFIPDGSIRKQTGNTELAAAGTFRAVETTDYYLYGIATNGEVRTYNGTSWLDLSSPAFPQGLSGGTGLMMAASKKHLYLITKAGNILGRVPSDLSGTGSAFWEKINLPNNESPVDIRNRGNDIFVESETGKLYKRIVGSGWQLVN